MRPSASAISAEKSRWSAGILTTAKKKRTVATINILKLALNAYYQEFQDYPPIHTDGTASKSLRTKNSNPWDQVVFKTGGAVTQVNIGSFNRSGDNEGKRRDRIEALFYFLTTKFRGVANSPFISNSGELNLIDIDNDGRPEIADAWVIWISGSMIGWAKAKWSPAQKE